jgi:hypothetical protein
VASAYCVVTSRIFPIKQLLLTFPSTLPIAITPLAVDMPVPALTPKAMLPLRQVPQDLNPFHGRVSSDLVHVDEDGRVLGWINRDHIAES